MGWLSVSLSNERLSAPSASLRWCADEPSIPATNCPDWDHPLLGAGCHPAASRGREFLLVQSLLRFPAART